MKKSSNLSPSFLLNIELRSHPKLLCVVRGAMEPLMESVGFSAAESRAIIRAVDEAVANIMRHSYKGDQDQIINISCKHVARRGDGKNCGGIEIVMFDGGPPIDKSKLHGRPLDEIRPGGLGLHLMHDTMDRVEFKRTGNLNRLRMVKYAQPSKSARENLS